MPILPFCRRLVLSINENFSTNGPFAIIIIIITTHANVLIINNKLKVCVDLVVQKRNNIYSTPS